MSAIHWRQISSGHHEGVIEVGVLKVGVKKSCCVLAANINLLGHVVVL